jgi:ATP-dependent Clp protease ATP-binding subunit ClpA
MMVAQETARQRRRQRLGTDDLLMGLAEPNGTSSSQALAALGVVMADIRGRAGRARWRSSPGHIPMAADTKRAIEAAVREADNRGDAQVGSDHLLLGLVAERHGAGGRIISELGLSYDAVRAALASVAEPESGLSHGDLLNRVSSVDPESEKVDAEPGSEVPDAPDNGWGLQAASVSNSACVVAGSGVGGQWPGGWSGLSSAHSASTAPAQRPEASCRSVTTSGPLQRRR